MTLKEALGKHKISPAKWEMFIGIAQSNIRAPEGKSKIKEYLKSAPAWAYVGGMRDSLWAWVGGDREAYNALEVSLTAAAQKILKEAKKA